MIMTLKCWPSRYNCRIHNHSHGGGFSTPSGTTSARSQLDITRTVAKYAPMGRHLSKAGSAVAYAGAAQMAAAPFHNPYKDHIWMNTTKRDFIKFRGKEKYRKLKSHGYKIDWVPRDRWKRVPRPDYYKVGWTKGDAHRYRRPQWTKGYWRNVGQPTSDYHITRRMSNPNALHQPPYKQREFRKGLTKFGVGKSMRALGKGLLWFSLAYHLKQMYDDPSQENIHQQLQSFFMIPEPEQMTSVYHGGITLFELGWDMITYPFS